MYIIPSCIINFMPILLADNAGVIVNNKGEMKGKMNVLFELI